MKKQNTPPPLLFRGGYVLLFSFFKKVWATSKIKNKKIGSKILRRFKIDEKVLTYRIKDKKH